MFKSLMVLAASVHPEDENIYFSDSITLALLAFAVLRRPHSGQSEVRLLSRVTDKMAASQRAANGGEALRA